MKRPVLHAILLLLSAMILTSCGKREDIPEKEEIRAISLAPALTELAFHLGGGDSFCGRTDVCTYPPEAEKLPVTNSMERSVAGFFARGGRFHEGLLIIFRDELPQLFAELD